MRLRYAKQSFSQPNSLLCVFLYSTKLTPTLKSNKVAGLFGLPSNDAYAVVQTQNALNGETHGEDLHINILDFAVFEHVSPLRG